MWRFLEKLSEAAEAYREKEGKVGARLADWIEREYGIEVALRDERLGQLSFESPLPCRDCCGK